MAEYYLMNKNRRLMLFETVISNMTDSENLKEVERYVDDEGLPPGFTDINTWVDRRNYAKHKTHLQRWLSEWGINNVRGFMDVTRALSLNDSLWICPADSGLTWESVNLYSNEFSDIVSRAAFEKGLFDLKLSSTSPEFTSEGSFQKCWIREEGDVYLYKKGGVDDRLGVPGLEPYSEFYASQYSSAICKESVSYDLIYYKDNLVSTCRMFTTEAEGYVPVYRYLLPGHSYVFDELMNYFEDKGMGESFRDMIVLDAVIFNPDRHFGNFGFIVDNDTFEIKRFAPVFDHNMSMMAHIRTEDMYYSSYHVNALTHKIGGNSFISLARYALTDRTRRILKELKDEPLKYHDFYNLETERLQKLEQLIKQQIRRVLGEE